MNSRWLQIDHVLVILIVAFALSAGSFALAQDTVNRSDLAIKLEQSLKPHEKRLDEISRILKNENPNQEHLSKLRVELDKFGKQILKKVVDIQPTLSDLKSRINSLPPLPDKDGVPEPDEIAAERKSLSDAKARTLLAMRDAEIMTVRAGGLLSDVLDARRHLFVSSLFERRTLDAETIGVVGQEFVKHSSRVTGTLYVWLRTLFQNYFWNLALALGLTTLVGIFFFIILRPLRLRLAQVETSDNVAYLQRVTLAFFSIVLPAAAAAILAASLHLFLTWISLYRLRVDQIMPVILGVIVGVYFVWLLLRAVLAPRDPPRRLLNLSDAAARRLMWLGMSMAILSGIDYLTSRLIAIFDMPVEFTVVKSAIGALLFAGILIAIVGTRLRDIDPAAKRTGYRGWSPILYWLLWLSIFAIVFAQMASYVSLGRFIAGQIIFTGSIAATLYIGFLASRAIATQGAMATTRIGAYLRSERDYSELRLDQFGLIASILINFVLLAIGVPVVLLQFGYLPEDIMRWVSSLIFGFTVGGVEISVGRILGALLVFILLVALTRMVQRWFDGKILARTQLDSGVKNSVKAGVGYVGFSIAAVVGISWAGFNLSNLALVVGALSVGIGFGLQNIVNNFVSGIIMLIERPIKVGDIIELAGTQGFVRKINVRATEIETFNRQSYIVPNSEVINSAVGNWMHTDSIRRIIINVGVAYGSDVDKVRELLLATLEGDERIASFPPPFVYFADFGSSSLDFQLRVFIRDIMETPFVESDIRFAIDKAFRENGIEIPFPQTDLHIRSGLTEALQTGKSGRPGEK